MHPRVNNLFQSPLAGLRLSNPNRMPPEGPVQQHRTAYIMLQSPLDQKQQGLVPPLQTGQQAHGPSDLLIKPISSVLC